MVVVQRRRLTVERQTPLLLWSAALLLCLLCSLCLQPTYGSTKTEQLAHIGTHAGPRGCLLLLLHRENR
jgi:hypothetical protein